MYIESKGTFWVLPLLQVCEVNTMTISMIAKLIEEYDTMKMFDISIMLGSDKIGYAELFISYDEDGDESAAYVKSIEIKGLYRNNGYGTEILKALAEEHRGIYICPDNDDAERLYARLGEETSAPREFESELDNWGKMYVIY